MDLDHRGTATRTPTPGVPGTSPSTRGHSAGAVAVATRPAFSPARLRAARIAVHLTQADLAAAIRRQPLAVQRYEAGQALPSLDALTALVAALRLPTVAALFDHPPD